MPYARSLLLTPIKFYVRGRKLQMSSKNYTEKITLIFKQDRNFMKIALLSQNASSYFHERIIQAAKQRNHSVQILRLPYCYMNISATTPKVYHRDTSVEDVD